MTKQELIKNGKHYFENKSVKIMYATSDGNFFHEDSKSFADSHKKTRNLEMFTITRADMTKGKDAPESGNDSKGKGKSSAKVKKDPKSEEVKEPEAAEEQVNEPESEDTQEEQPEKKSKNKK